MMPSSKPNDLSFFKPSSFVFIRRSLYQQVTNTQNMELPFVFLAIPFLLTSAFRFSITAEAEVSSGYNTDAATLLSFKAQIHADPMGVFSSWNESLHHCQWQGVLCGRKHPDRVTALVLQSKQLSGYVSPSLANLTFLQRINLFDNHLGGNIPVELGYLRRLRYVNLRMNALEGSIPSTLGNCSSLELISLSNNNLRGTIPSNLAQCKELKIVDLLNNFLTGDIPREFGSFPKLVGLGLSVNNLTGSIPSTLGRLRSLKFLYLDQNNLGGQIPDSLGELLNLSNLQLYMNNFIGSIPLSLCNLTNLSVLYLDQNKFNGHIPAALGNLTNLVDLTLYRNGLTGSIPSTLGYLKNIEFITIFQNMFSGSIPDALGKLENLQWFDIFDNNISGEIPHSIYNISTMVELSLGNNYLKGTLPFGICDNFPNLQNLLLYFNQLIGQIPPSIANCSALLVLDLNSNQLSGTIPSNIGYIKNIDSITVSSNQLEIKNDRDWSFMDSLSNCTSLRILHLDNNQFQGVMPSSITNLSTSLSIVTMSYNPISGRIPTGIGKLINLNSLHFDHMLLAGVISEEMGNLFKLELLDVSSNKISGPIPSSFSNFTKMTKLLLNDNAFEGSIPPELGDMQTLELLNLSTNKLTGKIPKEIMSIPSLSISLDLSYNDLSDILPPEIGNFVNLQSIRLSNNKLLGEIPSAIGGCQLLQALYLDNNLFQRTIPSTLSNLRGLQILDVSNNSFSGQVPEFLSKMNLQYLNISFNNFEGEVPRQGIFENVSSLDVRGNPKLCGGVPQLHLMQCNSKPLISKHRSRRYIVLISSILGSSICLTIAMCLLAICYCRKRHQNNSQFDRALKSELELVSYNDLLRATESFSSENIIGRGTFGTVYKAVMSLENVTNVAIKVLNLEIHGASRSFFSECDALRNVRHRNLVKVLSSCSSIDHQGNDFKALVFEFMPKGNLGTWLHRNTDQPFTSLSLIERLNIVIDVASALDYLHNHGTAPIVHCDLKPNNVLLGDNMTAHVGDFGLARFLVQPVDTILSQSMSSIAVIRGSIGYIPPEYGMGCRPSTEGDVYSYGILLLETFTGVSPTDERFGDGLSLQKLVEMAFPEHVMDIVDNKLFTRIDTEDEPYVSKNINDCLVSVLRCGLLCTKESPAERIAIKDVVKELNLAQKKVLGS